MEKVKIEIQPEEWGQLVTKYRNDSLKLSAFDFTEGTANIDTDVNGNITKRKGGPNYNPTLLPAAPKDQYEAIFDDGARHLLAVSNGEIRYSTGDTVFNSVVNGTGFSAGANFEFAGTQNRIYGDNGVSAPQVYDKTSSYGGVSYTVPRMRPMGCQAPATTLTAAVGAAGSVPAGSYTYKVTFLYYGSEESNGSAASTAVVPGVASQINLTAIPIGGYGVTARKIYRSSGADWLLVGTLSNNTATTFTDNAVAGTFLIPDDNNVPPTFALIISWLGRLWVSKITGEPYTVQYSDTNLPDVFLSDNLVLCDEQDPITGMVVYLDRPIIFNRKTMGQILGLTSDSFRYSHIQGSVGCVDNRSIQIRVVNGVPILIWLSDRGFFSYDGNSIDYISDQIEDLVNFNIQQAVQQKNSRIQTTQSDFTAGTSSPAIDLSSTPDSITALNPKSSLSTQADWEGGLTKTNVVTKNGNPMQMPTRYVTDISAGVFNGVSYTNSSTGTRLPSGGNITGWIAASTATAGSTVTPYDEFANRITVPFASGQLTTLNLQYRIQKTLAGDPNTANLSYRIYDDVAGTPGSLLYSASATVATGSINTFQSTLTVTMNSTLLAGHSYWIGAKLTNSSSSYHYQGGLVDISALASNPNMTAGAKTRQSSGAWVSNQEGSVNQATIKFFQCNAVFSQFAVSASGQWTSLTYDSLSNFVSGTMSLVQNIANSPGSSTVQTHVEGSNDQSNWTIVKSTAVNLDATETFTGSAFRYWRLRSVFFTPDNRTASSVPALLGLSLLFPTTAVWISNGIDMTTDVTALNSLDIVSAVPSGTSLVVDVATSANNITYTSFTTLGSVAVQRYIRIRATFTTNTGNINTPTLTSLLLKWTTVSNIVSSAIDTGVVPSGWDIFQTSFTGNVSFFMKSAASSGALGAATFYAVTNGNFPPITVLPLQFTQWKAVLTAVADSLPVVSDVTVNWFIGSPSSLRTASIFVDGRYYIAAAELGQAANNLLIVYDLNRKWRVYKGLAVATFSYFFNRPYLGLATTGQIRKFLEGKTDAGTAIEVDVRTKALDFSSQYKDVVEKYKILAEVLLFVSGTGATYHMSYSVDEGATFIALKTDTGTTSITTTNNDRFYPIRFKPDYTSGVIQGRTIMFRVHSNDLNDVEIQGIKAQAFTREGDPVITG